MEFKNQYSKITFEDIEIKSENVFIFSSKKKYNTIKYSDIKEVKISSYKPLLYMMCLLGVGLIVFGFSPKDQEVLGTIYLNIPATMTEMVFFTIFGGLFISLGFYYFKIKYGKTQILTLKYFEGKIKSSPVFVSDNNKEIMDVKREIENRTFDK